MPLEHFRFLDPKSDISIIERLLPHWLQVGTLCFITWRTSDSIPKAVLEEWLNERWNHLRRLGIDPRCGDWQSALKKLDREVQDEFHRRFSERWNSHLDACHGECLLKDPKHSAIVSDALLRFDNDRYFLTDFVVMPNHVHLIAAFRHPETMLQQCESWKRYSATKINKLCRHTGRFWQQDDFDHLIRSEESFQHLRTYIRDNPSKARLKPGEFAHFSKQFPPGK